MKPNPKMKSRIKFGFLQVFVTSIICPYLIGIITLLISSFTREESHYNSRIIDAITSFGFAAGFPAFLLIIGFPIPIITFIISLLGDPYSKDFRSVTFAPAIISYNIIGALILPTIIIPFEAPSIWTVLVIICTIIFSVAFVILANRIFDKLYKIQFIL